MHEDFSKLIFTTKLNSLLGHYLSLFSHYSSICSRYSNKTAFFFLSAAVIISIIWRLRKRRDRGGKVKGIYVYKPIALWISKKHFKGHKSNIQTLPSLNLAHLGKTQLMNIKLHVAHSFFNCIPPPQQHTVYRYMYNLCMSDSVSTSHQHTLHTSPLAMEKVSECTALY